MCLTVVESTKREPKAEVLVLKKFKKNRKRGRLNGYTMRFGFKVGKWNKDKATGLASGSHYKTGFHGNVVNQTSVYRVKHALAIDRDYGYIWRLCRIRDITARGKQAGFNVVVGKEILVGSRDRTRDFFKTYGKRKNV